MSNKNDEWMNIPQDSRQPSPADETVRFQRPDMPVSASAQPRHRRSDRYKQQGASGPQTAAYVPDQSRQYEPAAPQWIERTPDDSADLPYETPARPAYSQTPPPQPPRRRVRPIIWVILLLLIAATVFFVVGPFSPLKHDPAQSAVKDPAPAAQVLEFKAASGSAQINTQLQLHLTTSPSVTGVKLTDIDGIDIPCTASSINADEETMRIWTVGVLFDKPFSGNVYATIRANDVWVMTDKFVTLNVGADAENDAPAVSATETVTDAPTDVPTEQPTDVPTEEPAGAPLTTDAPTQVPVSIVMNEATVAPTDVPTEEPTQAPTEEPTQEPTEVPTEEPTQVPTEVPTEAPTPAPTAIPTEAPSPAPEPLTASAAEGADPEALALKETVFQGSETQKDYARHEQITAPHPDHYAYNNQTGVYTFRGDNFRRNAAFGRVEVTQGQLDVVWSHELGSLRTDDSGTLYGVGWNNQPAIVKWTKEVREMMNLSDAAKATVGLREVIFSALDGYVYFLNLETGEETRSPIKVGYPMRGSVSVDPLGRPMISFGQAISKLPNKTGPIGYYLYNLIDQSEMHFINGRSSSSQKQYGSNGAFDGTSLFVYNEGKTAMLVASENGLFYLLDLNCEFTYPSNSNPDAQAAISINPTTTYLRHLASDQPEGRVTMESAVAMYNQYAFLADGYGIIRCVDTTTLSSVWAVDAGDNTDAALALDDQDGTLALYTGNTAFNRLGKKQDVTIRRLNAMTGEEMWAYEIKCAYNKSEQSGVKASPVVGQHDLAELVYFTVNQTDENESRLIALDKKTGEVKWEKKLDAESVSSPVAVYNEAGNGWIVQCDAKGNVYLLDGLSGYVNTQINLGGRIDASPAVYRDMLVVGTCSKDNHMMYGIRIH